MKKETSIKTGIKAGVVGILGIGLSNVGYNAYKSITPKYNNKFISMVTAAAGGMVVGKFVADTSAWAFTEVDDYFESAHNTMDKFKDIRDTAGGKLDTMDFNSLDEAEDVLAFIKYRMDACGVCTEQDITQWLGYPKMTDAEHYGWIETMNFSIERRYRRSDDDKMYVVYTVITESLIDMRTEEEIIKED